MQSTNQKDNPKNVFENLKLKSQYKGLYDGSVIKDMHSCSRTQVQFSALTTLSHQQL